MRELTIEKFCDNTEVHDQRVPATVERIGSLDQQGERLLDLCERCDRFYEAWKALLSKGTPLDKVVQPPRQPPRVKPVAHENRTGRLACGWVDPSNGKTCPFRSDSEAGLTRHRTRQGHHQNVAEVA